MPNVDVDKVRGPVLKVELSVAVELLHSGVDRVLLSNVLLDALTPFRLLDALIDSGTFVAAGLLPQKYCAT